jgi:CheY-like chemotaxis protein
MNGESKLIDSSKLIAMVIDDQPMMRSIIRSAMKQFHVTTIIEAASGNEALDILRTAQTLPHFIFCDLYMEDGQGTEFINTMRRDSYLKTLHIPIIVLTGEDDQLLHDVCRQVGAVTVLCKPCSLPQIAAAISKIVGYDVLNKVSA